MGDVLSYVWNGIKGVGSAVIGGAKKFVSTAFNSFLSSFEVKTNSDLQEEITDYQSTVQQYEILLESYTGSINELENTVEVLENKNRKLMILFPIACMGVLAFSLIYNKLKMRGY